MPLTVAPPETVASLALRTPTVATPRILRLVSTVISSLMNKLLPTNKSPPVVVIPPRELIVPPISTFPPTVRELPTLASVVTV